ncbi:MAG: hypothetical protein ACE5DP_03700 [Fidelibacterota bacterium]
MRIFLILMWWSLPLLGSENDLLANIRAVLLQSPGIGMNVQVRQIQYDNTYATTGYVEILDPNRYYFDSDEQTILVDNQTIKTWNKARRQLIIDTVVKDEFNLFSLLSGDFQGLEVISVDSLGETITLSFSVSELSITGKLTVSSSSLHPLQIQFTYDEDNLFTAQISNFHLLDSPTQFQQFKPQPKEVLDLRE